MHMKQKKMKLTSQDVKVMFETNLGWIKRIATRAQSPEHFKVWLAEELELNGERQLNPQEETIRSLIMHDGWSVKEASTGKTMKLETITTLWNFLTGTYRLEAFHPDFLIDVYKQFEALGTPGPVLPTKRQVQKWASRWEKGTDAKIQAIRRLNKHRIIARLVEHIDGCHSGRSRYVFPDGIDVTAKHAMVEEWWNDYRFHLVMAARSLRELNHLMGDTLSEETKSIYKKAQKKGIPVFVTPYYISLMDTTGEGFDDVVLRSYVFYSHELVDTFGNIKAWEKEDQVEPGKPNAAGWLLPEGNNIHRRYPEVAILIPDTGGRACGGLCASCQRLYDFQSGRFNFDLDALKPKETWDGKLRRLMKYYREDKQLRDILITGGDALMSRNKSLRKILDAVYIMAKLKREDNKARAEGEKYAEIERVRLGTRLPVYLPMRIDDELVEILREFRQKAEEVGIRQFFIQTHFQTPLEITPEVCQGIQRLHSAGWTVTNQLVFNVAASRRGHTAKLRQELNNIGILCYYTFSVKGFEENHAVFAPNSRSLQEQKEEKVFGQIPVDDSTKMIGFFNSDHPYAEKIQCIRKHFELPFLATDRNVMNLPGIGKSMTFQMVAIMPDGCRLLAFHHDATRRHSPIIKDMPVVYIKENKSIAEYLGQLVEMGEKLSDYNSLWLYSAGQTEPRFGLYEYDNSVKGLTTEFSNIAQDIVTDERSNIPHAS